MSCCGVLLFNICRCQLHESCLHLLRIKKTSIHTYLQQECGQHTNLLHVSTHGIHAGLIDKVDEFLRSGGRPKKVLAELNRIYATNYDMLPLMPTVRQI